MRLLYTTFEMSSVTRVIGFALALCAGVLLACATRGSSFDVDSVGKIEPGITTQAEVREWFGNPTSIKVRGSGGNEWRYLYEEEKRHDTRTLTKIGRFFASIFGHRVYAPPVDVAYAKTTRYTLNVQFDDFGQVIDYDYERRELPSHRVY